MGVVINRPVAPLAVPAECATCISCGKSKPLSDFYMNGGERGSLRRQCKFCICAAKREKRALAKLPATQQHCPSCNTTKPIAAFATGRGYGETCQACRAAERRAIRLTALELSQRKRCKGCDSLKPFTDFVQVGEGRYRAWCVLCEEVQNRLSMRSLVDIDKPQPRAAPAYVGEMPISRYEAATFLREHEGQNPNRYAGAGVVIRPGMSEAAQAYLARFTR